MESSIEISQTGGTSNPKPSLAPKPRLTPKPFSLQKNTAIRSIHAPKRTSATSKTTTQQTGKSEASGVPKPSVSTPALKFPQQTTTSDSKPSSVSVLTKDKPKPTKESRASPYGEDTLDSRVGKSDPASQTAPPKETPKSEPIQRDDVIHANHKASTDIINSEQIDGKKTEDITQTSVVQMVEESGSDVSSIDNPAYLWGSSRKRLSTKLTSKFESAGLSPPPQPSVTVSTTSTKDEAHKPESSDPKPNQTTSGPSNDEGALQEAYSGGGSIKRRISLLFDSSSRPEAMTKREEPEILNGTGGVKERIKTWATETIPEVPKTEKKPQFAAQTLSKSFEPATAPTAEKTTKVPPEPPSSETSAIPAVDLPLKVSPAEQSTETPTETSKDGLAEVKPSENLRETLGEHLQNKSTEGDVKLRNHSSSTTHTGTDEGDSAESQHAPKRNDVKRRSVRFGIVERDDGGPPLILGSASDSSEEEEEEDTSGDEAEEDIPVSVPVYKRVGGLQKKDDGEQEKERLKHLEFEKRRRAKENEQAGLKLKEEQKQKEEEREKEKARQREDEERERERLKEEEMERQRMEEYEQEVLKEQERERQRLREEEMERERQMELMWQRQREEERQRGTQKEERLKQDQVEREKERMKEEARKEERLREERERQMPREDEERLIHSEEHRLEGKLREKEINRIKLREEEWEKDWVKKTKMQRGEEGERDREKELELIWQRQKEEDRERATQKEERLRQEEREKERLRMEAEERERERQRMLKEQQEVKEEMERKRQIEMERQKEEDRERVRQKEERLRQERLRQEEREKERLRMEAEERERERQRMLKEQQEKEEELERMRQIEMEKRKEEDRERVRQKEERFRQEERETERLRMELEERERERQRMLKELQKKEEELERMRQIEMERQKEEGRREEERNRQVEKERVEELERKLREELDRKRAQQLEEEIRMEDERKREERESVGLNLISFDSEDVHQKSNSLYSPSVKAYETRERQVEVDYDDFSVRPTLLKVDFDDFSVKPKRWGSQAKVETSPLIQSWPAVSVDEEEVEMLAPLDVITRKKNVPEQVEKPGSPKPTLAQERPEEEQVISMELKEKGEEETQRGEEEETPREEEEETMEDEVDEEDEQEAPVNSYSTNDEDTDALIDNEPDQQNEACEQTSEIDSPKPVPDQVSEVPSEDVDTTDFFKEPELAQFPESSTPLLDTSVQKSKADLVRRRTRTHQPRSLRGGLAPKESPDWRTRDSTDEKEASSKQRESDSDEDQPKAKIVCSPSPTSQRVPMFPGLSPAALVAQLKKRTGRGEIRGRKETEEDKGREEKESQNEEAAPSPSQRSRSTRSAAHLAGAARVLPPLGSTDAGAISSPAWLKELKSRKRLSQYDSEA